MIVILYSYHDKGRVEGLLRRSPHELPARLERLLQVFPSYHPPSSGCSR